MLQVGHYLVIVPHVGGDVAYEGYGMSFSQMCVAGAVAVPVFARGSESKRHDGFPSTTVGFALWTSYMRQPVPVKFVCNLEYAEQRIEVYGLTEGGATLTVIHLRGGGRAGFIPHGHFTFHGIWLNVFAECWMQKCCQPSLAGKL
jgi:hypothetical protein